MLADNTIVLICIHSPAHPWGHAQAGRNEDSHTSINKGEVGGCENLWLKVTETFEQIRKKMEGMNLLGGYYILRKTF